MKQDYYLINKYSTQYLCPTVTVYYIHTFTVGNAILEPLSNWTVANKASNTYNMIVILHNKKLHVHVK